MKAPYPFKESVYFMSKDEVIEIPIREAYKFRTLRKVLYDQWDLINFKSNKAYEIG